MSSLLNLPCKVAAVLWKSDIAGVCFGEFCVFICLLSFESSSITLLQAQELETFYCNSLATEVSTLQHDSRQW